MVYPNDFQTHFCRQYAIKPENYADEILKRTAYTHSRSLLKLLGAVSMNYLQADYDFIHDVGRINRFREYEQTVKAFFEHPMNQNNPLRNILLLRISSVRMRRLVREVLQNRDKPIGTESTNPYGIQSPDAALSKES